MATVERFEDLKVWQKARLLTGQIFQEVERSQFSRRYRFCDQFTAASVSVMNNIAEGFERGSRKDFLQFLHVAKGSAGEVRSMLYTALDGRFITEQRFKELHAVVVEISRMLAGLIAYLQKTPRSGPRHHNFEL